MQGQCADLALNETGRRQAELLGRRLKNEKIHFIASSTLRRAIETTDIIVQNFDESKNKNYVLYEGEKHPSDAISVMSKVASDLMEMCFGPEFEGKHFDRKAATVPGNIHNQLATIVKMWVEGELNHVMPGGESPLQVCQSSDRPLYFIFY